MAEQMEVVAAATPAPTVAPAVPAAPVPAHPARHSFNRFDRSLTERILTHLTLEDKIRLECVNKRWEQVIYELQNVLIVNNWDENRVDRVRELLVDRKVMSATVNVAPKRDQKWRKRVESSRLRKFLVKCPYIQMIQFLDVFIDDSVLDAIIQLCPDLDAITLPIGDISDEMIIKFGQRFGPQLANIGFRECGADPNLKYYTADKQRLLMAFCSVVETMICDDALALTIAPQTRLRSLSLNIFSEELDDEFFGYIANFAPNLKILSLIETDEQATIKLNIIIKVLNNLEELFVGDFILDPSFLNNLHLLTPNLQRLIFEFSEFRSISDELLESFAKLSSLTELSIETGFFMNSVSEEGILHLIESCPQIRHIDFQFPPEISYKVIDKMVELARKRPEESFSFMCFGEEKLLLVNYTEEDEREVKNLKIRIFETMKQGSTSSSDSNQHPNSSDSDVFMLSMSLSTVQLM